MGRALGMWMGMLAIALAGCSGPEAAQPDGGPPPIVDPQAAPFHYVEHLPHGEAQREVLCSLGRDDRLTRWYCAGDTAPDIDSIETLLAGVGLTVTSPNEDDSQNGFAAAFHSTALGPLGATVLNPRVVFFSPLSEPGMATAIYTRGEFAAELAMWDEANATLNMYLVMYRLACLPDCSPASRYLEAADSSWREVSVYAERDLQNTALDCVRCHAPSGGNSARGLRMHELPVPWPHWIQFEDAETAFQFADARPDGATYAGIPVAWFRTGSSPRSLENAVRAFGGEQQPVLFTIEHLTSDTGGPPNAMWLELYAAAQRGELVDAPPHFAKSPFRGADVADARQRYRLVATGEADRASFPDVTRGLFTEQALRYIGYKPAEGLDGDGIVDHMCTPCHDGRFPGVTRDNFRAADFPDELPDDVREQIEWRLQLGDDDPRKMPPVIAGELDAAEIQRVLDVMTPPEGLTALPAAP